MEVSYTLLHDEAEWRKSLIEGNVQYELFLSIGEDSFVGSVSIQFFLNSAPTKLWLDYSGKFINSIEVNDSICQSTRSDNKLYLKCLKQGLNQIQISFESYYSTNGTGLHKFTDPMDGRTYIYSYMCPYYANKVFPCFDQPDIKGEFTITLEANEDFKVYSNEEVRSRSRAYGRANHIFCPTKPISTYIVAIICGEFTGRKDELDRGIFCRQSLFNFIQFEGVFGWTRGGMNFYQEFFQKEYAFGKYDQVFCPEFNMGAMECAGCVEINDNYVWKEQAVKSEEFWLYNTVLHEMCHMWFGNLVTLKWWDDLWLNESFATYFSFYANEEIAGGDSWISFLENKVRGYAADTLKSTHAVRVQVTDTQEAISNLDSITYWKGASLLKQLIFTMGLDAFRRGMVSYFNKYEFQNVTVYDFVDTLQDETEFNLRDWTQEWVLEAGINSIRIEWEVEDGIILNATAYQNITSGTILRKHVLLVEGMNEEGTLFKEKIKISNVEQQIVLELIGKPAPKGIIVNSEDHAYVEILIDSKSLEFFFINRQINSISLLNRGVLWLSIWSLVEEQLLSSTVFLDLVSQLLPSEPCDEIVDIILGNALKATFNYLPYEMISAHSQSLVQAIKEKLSNNAADKNTRKLYLERKLFGFLFSDDDIREAYRYSLSLARAETWRGIMSLASIIPYEEIKDILAQELKYDTTDNSLKLKLYCDGAAFDNKKFSWDLILSRGELSLSQLEFLMKGFNQFNQKEVLKEYAQQFFEYLPSIFNSQDREYAEAFFRYLLPRYEKPEVNIEKLLKINSNQKWVQRILDETIESLRKDSSCQMVVKAMLDENKESS